MNFFSLFQGVMFATGMITPGTRSDFSSTMFAEKMIHMELIRTVRPITRALETIETINLNIFWASFS